MKKRRDLEDIFDAVNHYSKIGEICTTLKEVLGEYHQSHKKSLWDSIKVNDKEKKIF